MRTRFAILTTLFLFAQIAGTRLTSHAQTAKRTLGKIERFDSQLDHLLGADASLEILADGFTWTEGPVWMGDPINGHLLFSDIPRNSTFKWTAKDGIQLFMNPSGYTGVTYYGLEPGSNGLLKDLDGNLVSCEHGDRRVSVLTPGGGKRTLVDNYQGKRLNSPNDGVLKSNGDIYFTDPPYGLPMRELDPRRELAELIFRETGWIPLGSCPVRFEGETGWVEAGDSGKLVLSSPELLAGRTVDEIGGYPATYHVRDFLDCVKTRSKPKGNADAACNAHIACHAANIALHLGRQVKYDNTTHQFVNDEQANRLRSEALREPWRV